MDDDLELSKLLNAALNKLANSSGSAISFSQSGSYNAWTLTGRYQISGNEVTVRANLKQANEVKFRFELKGKRSDLTALAEQMIEKAMDLLK
jgi:kynureninase